jgi:hypothetical protein
VIFANSDDDRLVRDLVNEPMLIVDAPFMVVHPMKPQ